MSHGFAGVIPILPTPFHDDGTLDVQSFDRLVRFNVGVGVNAIMVLGQDDDGVHLTLDERAEVVRVACAAAGQTPIIAGVPNGASAGAVGRQSLDLGAAAVAVAPMMDESSTSESVVEQFDRVESAVSGPIVLLDNPTNSRMHLPVDIVLRLVREFPSIASVRMQNLANPAPVATLRHGLSHRAVTILTGLGALWGLLDLERGADGFNAAFAFPEVLLAALGQFRTNNRSGARQIFTKYLPLIAFEQQASTVVQREMLRSRGLITSARVRNPSARVDQDASAQLADLFDTIFPGEDIGRRLDVNASRPFLVNI